MPRVSREQTDKNRLLIEAASARLFKEHGFDGVSVADIMASAGLTHGGFYGHFESKDELAALACAKAFEESAARWRSLGKDGADEAALLDASAKHYLSAKQRDQPGLGCRRIRSRPTSAARMRQARARCLYARTESARRGLTSYSEARQTKAA